MIYTLDIRIRNKIPIIATDEAMIVCGNSNYQIKFDFDEEWNAYRVKTARFTYKGKYQDVVFEGDTVAVPVLKNATALLVGVYAGDIRTTVPALIRCRKSILCEDGSPDEPTPDVYAQIMELLNQSGGGGGSSGSNLPYVTEDDDGKVLTVSGGKWVAAELPKYEGAYEVTPSADEDQTLLTASKYMDADIKISKIPYSEVLNNSGGTTVNIGG